MNKLLWLFPVILLFLLTACGKVDNKTILFVGDTCPHCKIVEQFLIDNKADQKLKYEIKEVFNNKENSQELSEYAKRCSITQELGVPFLVAEGKCFMGQDEVMKYFEKKLNLPKETAEATSSSQASPSSSPIQ